MALFARPQNTAPNSNAPTDAVPAELAEAYEAATPNAAPFIAAAAHELAVERRRRQIPDSTGAIIITPEDVRPFYTDHLPELLARAEHLSRLSAARWVAREAERAAERQREIAEKYTCPVCHEVSREIHHYHRPGYIGTNAGKSAGRMCPACRHTADLLYLQATATPERRSVVQSALDTAAQRP